MLWNSLYLPLSDAEPIIAALRDSLTAFGYTPILDPFGLIPGKAYSRAVRLFVAPVRDGWVRVIGDPDPRQISLLSQTALCLHVALDGSEATITTYANGEVVPTDSALAPYSRCSEDVVHKALYSDVNIVSAPSSGMPFDALPDDVQAMARGVDLGQAQKMFARLSGNLMKRAGDSDTQDAAQALISGGSPDWSSAGGRRISALMSCLLDDWREPDFVTLRDAYSLHVRRKRKPDARLYPGDAEAMETVPDALDFVPVYGGAGANG